jgi:hypothetical protein
MSKKSLAMAIAAAASCPNADVRKLLSSALEAGVPFVLLIDHLELVGEATDAYELLRWFDPPHDARLARDPTGGPPPLAVYDEVPLPFASSGLRLVRTVIAARRDWWDEVSIGGDDRLAEAAAKTYSLLWLHPLVPAATSDLLHGMLDAADAFTNGNIASLYAITKQRLPAALQGNPTLLRFVTLFFVDRYHDWRNARQLAADDDDNDDENNDDDKKVSDDKNDDVNGKKFSTSAAAPISLSHLYEHMLEHLSGADVRALCRFAYVSMWANDAAQWHTAKTVRRTPREMVRALKVTLGDALRRQFVIDGKSRFFFAHETFGAYLAARYLTDDEEASARELGVLAHASARLSALPHFAWGSERFMCSRHWQPVYAAAAEINAAQCGIEWLAARILPAASGPLEGWLAALEKADYKDPSDMGLVRFSHLLSAIASAHTVGSLPDSLGVALQRAVLGLLAQDDAALTLFEPHCHLLRRFSHKTTEAIVQHGLALLDGKHSQHALRFLLALPIGDFLHQFSRSLGKVVETLCDPTASMLRTRRAIVDLLGFMLKQEGSLAPFSMAAFLVTALGDAHAVLRNAATAILCDVGEQSMQMLYGASVTRPRGVDARSDRWLYSHDRLASCIRLSLLLVQRLLWDGSDDSDSDDSLDSGSDSSSSSSSDSDSDSPSSDSGASAKRRSSSSSSAAAAATSVKQHESRKKALLERNVFGLIHLFESSDPAVRLLPCVLLVDPEPSGNTGLQRAVEYEALHFSLRVLQRLVATAGNDDAMAADDCHSGDKDDDRDDDGQVETLVGGASSSRGKGKSAQRRSKSRRAQRVLNVFRSLFTHTMGAAAAKIAVEKYGELLIQHRTLVTRATAHYLARMIGDDEQRVATCRELLTADHGDPRFTCQVIRVLREALLFTDDELANHPSMALDAAHRPLVGALDAIVPPLVAIVQTSVGPLGDAAQALLFDALNFAPPRLYSAVVEPLLACGGSASPSAVVRLLDRLSALPAPTRLAAVAPVAQRLAELAAGASPAFEAGAAPQSAALRVRLSALSVLRDTDDFRSLLLASLADLLERGDSHMQAYLIELVKRAHRGGRLRADDDWSVALLDSLLRLLSHEKPYVRAAAVSMWSTLRFVGEPCARVLRERFGAEAELAESRDTVRDDHELFFASAMRIVPSLATEIDARYFDMASRALHMKWARVRVAAAESLSLFRDKHLGAGVADKQVTELQAHLFSLMRTRYAEVRFAAIRALSYLSRERPGAAPSAQQIRVVQDLLADASGVDIQHYGLRAAAAAGGVCVSRCLDAIVRLLRHKHPALRKSVIRALQELPEPLESRVENIAVACVNDSDPHVRFEALHMLRSHAKALAANRQHVATVDKAARARSENSGVQLQALQLVAELGELGVQHASAISALLRNSELSVLVETTAALMDIGLPAAVIVPSIIAMLGSSSVSRLKRRTIVLLGLHGPAASRIIQSSPSTFVHALSLLKDPDSLVRATALKLLLPPSAASSATNEHRHRHQQQQLSASKGRELQRTIAEYGEDGRTDLYSVTTKQCVMALLDKNPRVRKEALSVLRRFIASNPAVIVPRIIQSIRYFNVISLTHRARLRSLVITRQLSLYLRSSLKAT